MKTIITFIASIVLSLSTLGDSITLGWEPSPSPNIKEYKLYFSKDPNVWTHVKSVGLSLQTTVELSEPGVWYFIATAVDSNNLESLPSNTLSYTSPASPVAPQGMKLLAVFITRTATVVTSSNLVVVPNP